MKRRKARRTGRGKWLRGLIFIFFIFGALAAACRHANRARAPLGGSVRNSSTGKTAAEPPSADASNPAPKRPTASSATTERSSSELPASADTSRFSKVMDLPVCLNGCPTSSRSVGGRLLRREGWVLFNNPKTKFADWVAYRVSASTIGRSKPREWKADPDLPPEETLEPEDFQGAHAALQTDRGHQVPLASFSGTRNYEPLNYMSNVTPQSSVLNQKLWNLLEQAERHFVLENQSPLFVVTGPLYEKEMAQLPGADESHQIPSGYFKVIAAQNEGELESVAVIAKQETEPLDSFCANEVTIDEVEQRAGLDIFPLLSDQEARNLEGRTGTLLEKLGCP